MRVLLLRHGKAGLPDKDRWPNDLDRPLTRGGVKRLVKAAHGLANVGKVDRVFASPATRTRQTAKVMEEHAGWPKAKKTKLLADGTDPREVTDHLNRLHERGVQTVALVGHEPSLSSLASFMLTGDSFNAGSSLGKGGAASLEYHPQPGGSKLEWLMPNKALAQLDSLKSFSQ